MVAKCKFISIVIPRTLRVAERGLIFYPMDLDLIDVHFDLRDIKPRELEEALEDPFGVRFLPDVESSEGDARYYALGRTVNSRSLFVCFWTDGKTTRVIAAREMSENENRFYERRYAAAK